ncbi:hypothetical protein, conserved in T. vivax [Trypanosoma vivax Y486]|uniref:Trypanosome variant surface glycoprotein A-type N-terminal domain-containing protein n=1 Tax=Trypanosoma vivax (strain Y486) TaxID=1055687 RepID=F9WTD1_TRYVY|nr:hypothetical protein, conserved in T. vivax [Trypanosoma vivax Y486]|eukprot:CCD20824.1 hypothetical protein, conserved in T. vivax [Trypanosoma vivax Y486]
MRGGSAEGVRKGCGRRWDREGGGSGKGVGHGRRKAEEKECGKMTGGKRREMMLAATCFVVFGVAALGSTGSALGNKALTSADVQLVCTLSDALKRSAATALAQSTAATLAVERACASAENAISDFARRARSETSKQLVEIQRRLARSMQTQARGLSQRIGVDARLYALEAAQRAGKMDDMVQVFATYDGNPGTGKVCIVTADATTAKHSKDKADVWVGWGDTLKKCKDHTANGTIAAEELDRHAEALGTQKKLFTSGGGLIEGGVDGCMLLSSGDSNAQRLFKGSATAPGTATLGGIWYIKGVATADNGIELVLDDRRNEKEADLPSAIDRGKKAPLHTLRQKYTELSKLGTTIDESDRQCREAIQTKEDAQDTQKLRALVQQLVCLRQLKVAHTRGNEEKTLDEWLAEDTNNATTSTQEHTPKDTEAKQDTDTPANTGIKDTRAGHSSNTQQPQKGTPASKASAAHTARNILLANAIAHTTRAK